ncbi:MAG: ParB/RepB/Spo0J family partition protein [Planctomycetaceae bacterium]
MASTRSLLDGFRGHLDESIGVRTTESRPQLSPIASPKDIGRRSNRSFGRIEIERIQPDPQQPRTEFDDEALERLAASIRDKGQLAPIRVRWSEPDACWLIISGERRWRAAQRAGLKSIDCYFLEQQLNPTQILEEQLIENLLREDLQPIEEAESFRRLMEVNNWNGKQLAEALRINPTRVSRSLALLKLPHEMRTRIESGELSPRAGYELSKLPDQQLAKVSQTDSVTTITTAQATVRQRKGKAAIGTRGTKQTFFADGDWQVIVKSPRKGDYHQIEQALLTALEEVRLRINNRVKIL